MALSFKETRALQKEIQTCFASLENMPDFKTKRSLQKQLADAFAKLEGKAAKAVKSLYERLMAGEFLKEPVVRFVSILQQVAKEIGDDIKALHDPVIAYLTEHRNADGVYESANAFDLPNGDGVTRDLMLVAGDADKPKPASAVRTHHKPGGIGEDILIDIDTEFESPDTFREIVRAIESARECDTVVLKVNSHGGRTDSAQAVYAALLETKAKTVARVITAYSSGSIVAMSCDEIQTTPHCTMMIHNASAFSYGKVGDMKTQTTFLENHFKSWFDELYSGFLTPEEIADVFKGQDFWLNEEDIKARLAKWKPIRQRRGAEAQANNEGL